NYVGYRLTFAMLIVVNFFFDKELRINKYGYLWAFALPLLLKTLAFTASRGAILCFFSGLLIIGMLLKTKWFIKPIIFLLFIASILLAFSILDKNPVFHERYLKTVEGHDTAHRMEIWERLSDLFYVNPIMGIGETGYNQSTIEIFGRVRGSHNVYIEILLKTGIVGLFTFLLFIYSELKRSINSWANESKPFPLVMLFAILFLFTNIQGLYNKSIYLFFALILVASQTFKKEIDVN
ncbi:MAG: O-antigen ligase family protein, partial [Bacteroidota bacterium]|nr:O-antigen ligase family protein [Bacteroidota bacterium]